MLTHYRYPKYAYDASDSTLIIKLTLSPVHESVIYIINCGFTTAVEDLSQFEGNFYIVANQYFSNFTGQYDESTKTFDLAVEFPDAAGDLNPKFIVEVGLSETYEQLIKDAKLWLKGTDHVSIVVLMKFVENPQYQSLVSKLHAKDLVHLGIPKASEIEGQHFNFEGGLGPVKYKGLQWVGEISEAFGEVRKQDPETRLAVKDGARIIWSL